jgi:hypothetical protein
MKKSYVRPEYHETVVENNMWSFKKNHEKDHIIISYHFGIYSKTMYNVVSTVPIQKSGDDRGSQIHDSEDSM